MIPTDIESAHSRHRPPEALDRQSLRLIFVPAARLAAGDFIYKMAQTIADHYKGLAAAYTDAIRASDFKANIVMFFLSLVLGPIIFNRDKLPPYMTMPVLVAPFIAAFFCLFMALLPRYPRRGRSSFYISRQAKPADFAYRGEGGDETQDLQLRVAIFSDILYWKTVCLRIAFFICIACVVAAALLLAIYAR
jgi:hypothetical protein